MTKLDQEDAGLPRRGEEIHQGLRDMLTGRWEKPGQGCLGAK